MFGAIGEWMSAQTDRAFAIQADRAFALLAKAIGVGVEGSRSIRDVPSPGRHGQEGALGRRCLTPRPD